jgi:hypothetical protein
MIPISSLFPDPSTGNGRIPEILDLMQETGYNGEMAAQLTEYPGSPVNDPSAVTIPGGENYTSPGYLQNPPVSSPETRIGPISKQAKANLNQDLPRYADFLRNMTGMLDYQFPFSFAPIPIAMYLAPMQ